MFKRLLFLAPLAILAFALAAVALASRLYWGYWLTPPSASGAAACLASVETFTTYSRNAPPSSGSVALLHAAAQADYTSGENPRGRVAAALAQRRLLPSSPTASDASLRTSITSAIEAAGALKLGSPGYPYATDLYGSVAVGRDLQGKHVVVAAFSGGEVSNDHYPYYEAVLAVSPNGQLSLSRLRFYWYDVAGIEGLLGCLTAFIVAVPLLLLWLVTVTFHLVNIFWRRHARRAA